MIYGIILAIAAMFFWGFGDFFIQRSTRKVGDWETFFIITLVGAVILLPFVWHNLHRLSAGGQSVSVLLLTGIFLFTASMLEFEALRRGKMSVIEPTWSIEILVAALMAFVVLGEILSPGQLFIIIALIIGLFLLSYRGHAFSKNFLLERGVPIAVLSAIFMGVAAFFVGWSSRLTDAMMANFAVNVFCVVGSGIYLAYKKRLFQTFRDLFRYPKMLLGMSILDNGAWIAFAFAMTLSPIAIATAISEGYVIIAVTLGLMVNKEKLQKHQSMGLVVAVISAIILAVNTAY